MNDKIIQFIEDHYEETVHNAQELTFLPRDINMQREALDELTELLSVSNNLKEEFRKKGSGEAANQMLAFGCMIKSVRSELAMWIRLKEEKWDSAWDRLVDAQDYARDARKAHEIAENLNYKNHLSKLLTIEKVVFPPQVFMSPGMLVERFECSICGKTYADCEHIEGESYNGEFCNRVADEIGAMREVSIVDEPADKKARVMFFSTDDGMVRNRMTWKKSEPDPEQHPELTDDGMNLSGTVMSADDTDPLDKDDGPEE